MKTKTVILVSAFLVLLLLLWLGLALLQHFSVNFIAPIAPPVEGTVRVACVGDSFTYGMLLWNRASQCYPARLQALLGDGYSVRNYGANSTTVLSTGDHPYTHHKVYSLSAEFEPDIVLLMLGTNDSKPENWTSAEAFRSDYHALVEHYTSLAGAPAVYLMTPPTAIPKDGKITYEIDPQVLEEISVIVKDTAQEMGLPLIDIHALTAGREDLFSGIDGVHFNKTGAEFTAQQVFQRLPAA